jgi:phosphoribosylformimino-5-aminoimidazole carboxamide ribotide isomerase
VIYTDIGRDGMLTGINIDATVKLARALSIPVIASGGVSDLADIERCARSNPKASRRDLRPQHLQRRARLRCGQARADALADAA